MKRLPCYLFFFFVCCLRASAQQPVLVYFASDTARHLGGVRTTDGKVIVPGPYHLLWNEAGDTVGQYIVLSDTTRRTDSMRYNYALKLFDHSGKFLYSPFWFDNGVDYYSEGLHRFVENGKMGFATIYGEKVIAAQYNFVSPFDNGVAVACLDCRYVRFNNDEEHCCGYQGEKFVTIRKSPDGFSFAPAASEQVADSVQKNNRYPAPDGPAQAAIERVMALPEVKKEQKNALEKEYDFTPRIDLWPTKEHPYYLVGFGSFNSDFSFLVPVDRKDLLHFNTYSGIGDLREWQRWKAAEPE